jgi:hypothetical protein
MRITLALILVLAAGCTDPTLNQRRMEARSAQFKECMELAAQIHRQSDDQVYKIISACDTSAYYMTQNVN